MVPLMHVRHMAPVLSCTEEGGRLSSIVKRAWYSSSLDSVFQAVKATHKQQNHTAQTASDATGCRIYMYRWTGGAEGEGADLGNPDLLPPGEASAEQHQEGCRQARADHAYIVTSNNFTQMGQYIDK